VSGAARFAGAGKTVAVIEGQKFASHACIEDALDKDARGSAYAVHVSPPRCGICFHVSEFLSIGNQMAVRRDSLGTLKGFV
jgi:hypothetical protein